MPNSPPPSALPPADFSSLARWQRVLMVASAVAILAWLLFMWPRSPGWALAGLAAAAWAHATVLALESLLAANVSHSDSVPAPTGMQRLGAWWHEASITPAIFLWRQPFRWRDWPDTDTDTDTAEASPATSGSAVVLLHGFVCNRGFWAPWMKALRAVGVPYTSVNLEPVFGSIDAGIAVIEDAVDRAERLGKAPPVLVAHSMGGLAARAWLASAPGNLDRVNRIITIGSPHHGTWLARWSRITNGRQMRQHSAWLQALAAREAAEHGERAYAKFVCWYSNADHIVFPPSTALLPGAEHRHVPGVAHVALAFHPRVMRESLAMVMPASISPEARTAS